MGFLFGRKKVWQKNETILSPDLNAEFNNVLNNASLPNLTGYSTNVAQMQQQVSPGGVGSESLAQTTADELTRLRYVLAQITGNTYWYQTPALSIAQLTSLLSQGNAVPANRISSGAVRATSNEPAFLIAGGSTAVLTLKGSIIPFVYYIANTQYTISTDVTLTFGSFAPGSNNTATINDATLAGGASTAIQGENGTAITVSSAGSNITALQGNFGAFKVVDSTNTEYFIGFVNSSTSLNKCFRGYYFDSTYTPVVRTVVNNADTITLLKLFWVFATTSGTLDATSTNPKVQFATPSSPSTSDYWYDLGNNVWKKYNGSSFVVANATLIGQAVCDTSHCIATRSFAFYASYDQKNTCVLEIQDNNTVRTNQLGQVCSVAGKLIRFDRSISYWVKPDNLDTGQTDGNNKTFYVYLKDTGDVSLSTVIPYNRLSDYGGAYHPYNPWRSLGSVLNDGSSHFLSITQDTSYTGSIANAVANLRTRAVTVDGTDPGLGGVSMSASAGTFTTTSATPVDVTNLSTILTTSGRPVRVELIADGTSNTSFIGTTTTSNGGNFNFVRVLSGTPTTIVFGSSLANQIQLSPLSFVDTPAAGTYTYKLQLQASSATTATVKFLRIIAYEL